MRHAFPARRKIIVVDRLLREIPEVVRKYSIKGLDEAGFMADLESWLVERGIDTSLAGAARH
jgi:hypothetical protein